MFSESSTCMKDMMIFERASFVQICVPMILNDVHIAQER